MSSYTIEQVYTAYRGKVMGYIKARIRQWADAEDLCSEVFEKVQRKLLEYDESKAALDTWIFTISRNTLIDHFRKNRPSEELDENISTDSLIDENLLQNETLSELASALKKLPQQLMDIVVLYICFGINSYPSGKKMHWKVSR